MASHKKYQLDRNYARAYTFQRKDLSEINFKRERRRLRIRVVVVVVLHGR